MSEASIQKLKSLAAKVRASEAVDTTENETSDDTTRDKSDEATSSESKPKKSKVNHTQCLIVFARWSRIQYPATVLLLTSLMQ